MRYKLPLASASGLVSTSQMALAEFMEKINHPYQL
jgi:hypothetical protein